MFFDLSNYWMFVLSIAAIYVAIYTYAQNNVGGKGRLKSIQLEIRDVQKKMSDAAKNKQEKEVNDAISQNWKLTGELMSVQMKLFGVVIVLLLGLAFFFPYVEPGMADDVHMALFDDGLASHCDAKAGDGNFSNCYKLPEGGKRGAWVIDVHLYSSSNESLSKNGTAIYYEGGNASDVWLQSTVQSGLLDGFMGKVPHFISPSTDKANYTTGETVAIRASAAPPLPSGRLEAVINSGTFFYVDLPFSIPLINIRRIIGSYGLFIFSVFLLSMLYSIIKAVYDNVSKKKVS